MSDFTITRGYDPNSLIAHVAATFPGVVITQVEPAIDLTGELFPNAAQPDTLSKRLAERRISPETIQTFGITPNGRGWYYPTPNGGQRWKNADSHAPNKYLWEGGKPTTADFYHAPNLSQAINKAGGVCWYVSGEADTWAMYSAEIEHVLSGYTEAAVPDNLAEFLQAQGVMICYIAPDLDDTGRRWAGKVAGVLEGSGIELIAFRLPPALGKGGDLGKMWATNTSLVPFERRLLNLERLAVTPIREEKPEKLPLANSDPVPLAYRQAIETIFFPDGIMYKDNGNATKNAHCPFHDDMHPSMTLHKNIGGYCHTCGRGFSWQELGQRIKVGSIREWLNNASHTLSTQTRERLLQLSQHTKNKPAKNPQAATIARLLDTLYMIARWEPGHEFTIKQALEACMGILSKKTVRSVLNNSFSPFFPTIHALRKKGEDLGKNPGGRPFLVFRLLYPAEVGQLVDIYPNMPQHYDPLNIASLKSAKEYRAAVYATLPIRKPGTYSRKKLAQRVGVTPRTSRKYDGIGGLTVIHRQERERLKESEMEDLPNKREDVPGYVWLETNLLGTRTDKKTGEIITEARRFMFTREGLERAREAGAQEFYKVKQLTNRYEKRNEETN